MFYLDMLHVSPGLVSQYYDPMTRAFNIILIPSTLGIIFLMFLTSPLRKWGKGVQALVMVTAVFFMITNGLFASWVELANTWMFLFIAVGLLMFLLETFHIKTAVKYVGETIDKRSKIASAKGSIRSTKKAMVMESKMRAIEEQTRKIDELINQLKTELEVARAASMNPDAGPVARGVASRRVVELQRQIDKLIAERMRLAEKHARFKAEHDRILDEAKIIAESSS